MALQGRKPGWLLDKILRWFGRAVPEVPPPPPVPEVLPPPPPVPEALPPPPPVPEALPPPAEASPRRVEVPVPPAPPEALPPAPNAEVPAPPPAAPAEEKAAEPARLSPASVAEGVPDFTPAAPLPASLPAPGGPEDAVPGPAEPEAIAGAGPAPVPPVDTAEPTPPVPAPPEPVPPPAPPIDVVAETSEPAPASDKRGWFRRLADGMRRTSSAIGDGVTGLFTKRKLDRATLEDLEDILIGADLGTETAGRITAAVSAGRYDREIDPREVKGIMAGEIEKVLEPVAKPLVVDRSRKPFVLLMIGVNGAGKTTTIGKLAQKFRRDGLSVTIAAGDTFRAAAIEQLKVWGERVGAPVIARQQGADAASLAYEALEEARGRGADVLMIDTAGRLQNKAGLMAELEKIVRVLRKIDPEAPHATLLVLDATVGQNALSQVELFGKAADVTGLVMTKLDGTARGGILVALAAKFALPVHYIGVGEGVDDLEPFAARDFARAIAGLEDG